MGIDRFKTEGGKIRVKLTEDMKQDTEKLGYIIGVIISDGCVSEDRRGSKRITLIAADKEFVSKFGKVFSSWGGLKWEGINDQNTQLECYGPLDKEGNTKNQWQVSKCIADCYEFLNKFQEGEYQISKLLNQSEEFKVGLLRGMWDGEGNVSKDSRIITFTNSDDKVNLLYMKLVRDLVGVSLDLDGSWINEDTKSTKKKGEFRVTKKNEIGGRQIYFPAKYFLDFYNTVEPTIHRKKVIFEDHIENTREKIGIDLVDKSDSGLGAFRTN